MSTPRFPPGSLRQLLSTARDVSATEQLASYAAELAVPLDLATFDPDLLASGGVLATELRVAPPRSRSSPRWRSGCGQRPRAGCGRR